MQKNVIFYSEGCKISGDLYLPENINFEDKLPSVILCHGFAGIKKLLLPLYAEEFAKNGFAALTFDYRGFGESEGKRGHLVPNEQITDIRNAITFMQTLKEVDSEKIGLWGTSFGGANAISTAALDKRVKCVTAQLTFGNGERLILGGLSNEDKNKLISTINKAWERSVLKDKNLMVSPSQILTDEDSLNFYEKCLNDFPEIKTRIPFLVLQHIIDYKPEDSIQKISVPVLLIAAEKDMACPVSESEHLYNKANCIKKLVILENTRHYDTYQGKKFIQSADEAVKWYKKHFYMAEVYK